VLCRVPIRQGTPVGGLWCPCKEANCKTQDRILINNYSKPLVAGFDDLDFRVREKLRKNFIYFWYIIVIYGIHSEKINNHRNSAGVLATHCVVSIV
jgi:hypothetical protein